MLEGKTYHLIGIGGVGMSGLARLLKALGAEVTGCDLKESPTTRALEKEGIKIYRGHHPDHLSGKEVVIFSSAIKSDHPELKRAREKGQPVLPRAEMLSEIMALHPQSIAVAGSHGKTTTASMIAEVLIKAGLKPTVAIGGRVNHLGVNACLGAGTYLVTETDESDGSFLMLKPHLGVVTNIDREHLDFYADYKAIKRAFVRFCHRVDPEGGLILCGDDPGIKDIQAELSGKLLFYGFSPGLDLWGRPLSEGPFPEVEVFYQGEKWGSFRLSVPGRHNALNALAAVAVGIKLGLSASEVCEALSSFSGVGRRLEKKGEREGILVYDDYAHHPREIEATLKALKDLYPQRRLLVVFQPHRYTRTKALWPDFMRVLQLPDLLILTEIYPASERPLPGVTGEAFFRAIRRLRNPKPSLFATSREILKAQIEFLGRPGDVLLTMGAGDIYQVGEEWVKEEGLSSEVPCSL